MVAAVVESGGHVTCPAMRGFDVLLCRVTANVREQKNGTLLHLELDKYCDSGPG